MTLAKWLLTAIGIYAGFVGLLYLAQRALMYFPEAVRTAPAAAGRARGHCLSRQ